MGGLSSTNLGVQSVNLSVPASRGAFADLTNVEWYVEGYNDLGATPQNLTITYVNTASVTNTIVVSLPASFTSGQLIQFFPSIAGDVIESITSCQMAGSTGTAGNFGFTCSIRLTHSSVSISTQFDIQDVISCGMPRVSNNACLWFVLLPSASNISIQGKLGLLQG
jgi:hypothetical protein